MKNFFIFLFFLALGIAGFVGYFELKNSSTTQVLTSIVRPKFSVQNPPSDSLRGNITSLSGAVSFQGRGADYASPISSPQQIVQGDELSTLGDGKAQVEFSKIGDFSMLPKTNINIIQTLPQNFIVEQDSGEAIFERSGNIPFTIRSLDLAINLDDQTKVDVTVDKDNSQVLFTINSGEVTFYYTDTNGNSTVIPAKSGKQIIFDNNTKTFTVKLL